MSVAYQGIALRASYTARRDQFIDRLGDEFHLKLDVSMNGGPDVYLAFLKPTVHAKHHIFTEKSLPCDEPVFSFVPPSSGMFVWVSDEYTS